MPANTDYTYNCDTERVICPYCGEQNSLTEEIGTQGEMLDSWTCYGCDKDFNVLVHISISVTATKSL